MYLENSPFTASYPGLRRTDLMVFGNRLEEIILGSVPTSKRMMLASREDLASMAEGDEKTWRKARLEKVFSLKNPIWLEPDKLLLPLDCVDMAEIGILVEGVDKLVVDSSSKEWLIETCATIVRQFTEYRDSFLDPLTTLCNGNSLRDYLARAVFQDNLHLLLVESLSPARSVKEAFNHTVETARLLEEFNRFSFPIFHLGQSAFCFVIGHRDKDTIKSLCQSLTSFARNGGLRRIRIGFSSYSDERHKKLNPGELADCLLDEAWKALHHAGRRGPYSFCDFQLLVKPELFPLRTIDRSTSRKLSYRWKELDAFSLVYLKPDYLDRKLLDPYLIPQLKKEIVVVDEGGYFILRRSKSAAQSKKWSATLINSITKTQGERFSLSAGVSSYPFEDYTKSEIARNCMKALLHGTFLGPGSSVVFDSLSLNVSGDAYFNESDLSGAVREYRKGLDLAPRDVNLLNSLGVAYALMNMTEKAFSTFDQVLKIEPGNFMALFNRGLGEKSMRQWGSAVNSFTAALEVFNSRDDEERAVIGDLQFQLGICHFEIGEYRQCITVLKKWYKNKRDQGGGDRCLRFIGISYFHLGELRDAAKWLQRSLVANQNDAEVLSLLGTAYLKTGEGDDIALNLCERSVELEPEKAEFKIRYAHALAAAEKYDLALDVLASCTRSTRYRVQGWLEIARIKHAQGEARRCRQYLKKILSGREVDPAIMAQAKALQLSLADN